MGRPPEFRLSQEQSNALVAARAAAKKKSDHDLRRKIRALLLTGCGTCTRQEAAQICEVEVRSIFRWQRQYLEAGVDGLRPRPRPGKKPLLTPEQRLELAQLIEAGPEEAGLDTGIWTARLVGEQIRKRFEVSYADSHVRRLLHKLGFSVQFPRKKLAKADHEAQATWLKETLPALQERVKAEHGTLFLRTSACSSSLEPSAEPGPELARGSR